jgi:hypothetical protein
MKSAPLECGGSPPLFFVRAWKSGSKLPHSKGRFRVEEFLPFALAIKCELQRCGASRPQTLPENLIKNTVGAPAPARHDRAFTTREEADLSAIPIETSPRESAPCLENCVCWPSLCPRPWCVH